MAFLIESSALSPRPSRRCADPDLLATPQKFGAYDYLDAPTHNRDLEAWDDVRTPVQKCERLPWDGNCSTAAPDTLASFAAPSAWGSVESPCPWAGSMVEGRHGSELQTLQARCHDAPTLCFESLGDWFRDSNKQPMCDIARATIPAQGVSSKGIDTVSSFANAPEPQTPKRSSKCEPHAQAVVGEDRAFVPPGAPRLTPQAPLHRALRQNSVEAVRNIIAADPSIVNEPLWEYGCEPPLCTAINQRCDGSVVKELILARASVDAADSFGRSPLELLNVCYGAPGTPDPYLKDGGGDVKSLLIHYGAKPPTDLLSHQTRELDLIYPWASDKGGAWDLPVFLEGVFEFPVDG